jgi:hypothetical protein
VRFESSPGHSGLFIYYNQCLIAIKQGLEAFRSVPLTVGRSAREPPLDGANIKRPPIDRIVEHSRDAESASFIYAFTRREASTPAAFGRNDGIRASQRAPLVHERPKPAAHPRPSTVRKAASGSDD